MAFLNRVTLIGRLTDNPEPPRILPNSGSTVVKFRFAAGRSKKNKQTGQWENDPNPLYIDCEAFSKADFPGLTNVLSQHCHKGSEIYIEGRLQYDQWDDKNNPGQKRSKHKIVVEAVQLLGSKADGGEQQPASNGSRGGYQPPEPPFQGDSGDGEGNGDIPF